MAEERTYIPFTSRAKATTFDGILTEAHQIEDLDYGGAPKNQHDINAEVKANLARIEGIAGSAAAGAYVFKGSLNGLADLLLLKNVKVGDVYNIKTEFTLSDGKYPAGTNVAATKAMSASVSDGWDALGGTIDIEKINADIKKAQDKANAAELAAGNATKKAQSAETVAQGANSVASEANGVAAAARKKAETAEGTAQAAQTAATDAVNTANRAKTTAESANTTAESALTKAGEADKKAQEAIEKATANEGAIATIQANYIDSKKLNAAKSELQEKINAKVVNDKADKTSTDKALSAKATHEAIADALDVVAPDVTALTTSVENIKKFVTVPFDGYAPGSISIESMSTENVAQILYDMKSKSFVAKGTDGNYYNSWRVPDTDGRQRDLYINGMASHPKKLYVYKNEIYTISSLGLSLTIGKNLTTVDGEDNVRGVTQAAIAGKLKNYLTKGEIVAGYVSKTTYQELVDRVEKLEGYLKLA